MGKWLRRTSTFIQARETLPNFHANCNFMQPLLSSRLVSLFYPITVIETSTKTPSNLVRKAHSTSKMEDGRHFESGVSPGTSLETKKKPKLEA